MEFCIPDVRDSLPQTDRVNLVYYTKRSAHEIISGKLRESKKTDLFYHLLRNVSLPFLNHAGASASAGGLRNRHALTARSRHEQKEFKGADARLTPPPLPRSARRAGRDSVNSVNSVARQIVEQLIPCVGR
ncbi:hypothetical protein EVAR_70410_1 [Eumeta japonica]|uniref:Uncharacterized protein n=1 Tax=Eumeta variegata TaxID=151549 RepID=A0A4C2ABM6_EUMVA|nr:hypothetical protein EVAR_70410_1 [Eumeta japonica]